MKNIYSFYVPTVFASFMHEYEWLCGWMGRGLMDENSLSSPGLRDPILKLLVLYITDNFILMEIFFLERGWPLWQAPFKNWFIQLLYFKLDKLCLILKGNNKVTLILNICIYTHVYIHICIIFSQSLQNFLVETGTN